ncbi:signal recognition particle-docking protein FtsY [Achromobacter ruhlandii]|nr:signal recognition particle-docking protein FtsY [Achromobacter ruhlandii]AKP92009.1 Signal recognition particle receptor protein FtsY, alpha subunit [Achromobacter xylosoxidans]AOU95245.1 signal recognition particle-docking protein FtsY [Achromobacter ruhlandii]MCZ8431376.1 signal recognition particle-docking protein FtsY [Achromobacter ruhlandii]MDC6091220.1 signal recognition particle-docking protein FtsY [Achromobacter ruhlandii]MDC6149762.1 signal recognition particle-docking protein F
MFSRFFKKKSPPPAAPAQPAPPPEQVDAGIAPQAEAEVPAQPVEPAVPAREFAPVATPEVTLPVPSAEVPAPASASVPQPSPAVVPQPQASAPVVAPAATPASTPASAAPASAPVAAAPAVTPSAAAPAIAPPPVAPAPVAPPPAVTPPAPVAAAPAAIAPAPAAPEPEAAPKKASWLSRLKQGLSRTGQSIGGIFVGVKVDENLFEELESALIMADAGLEATEKLLTALRARVKKERIEDPAKVKAALRQLLADHLRPLERAFDLKRAQPLVVMIAGVNGAGKTTSIGKLAHTFQRQGASVLLAAGDTFRAAAREQLIEWGSRNNVTVISQDGGDPAAVAFDSVNAGRARGMGVVMVDTAGRLPTQLHLMEELKKIRRVIGKADPAAPHEVLLVVDGNTGQNALAQIRAFDAAINLTGLVVTKLDGTAKGGTLAAVAAGSQGVRPIPVYWIGVGESLEDLQPFVADEFAGALLAD